jgi:nucleotide-binding universal stress UspA family protein
MKTIIACTDFSQSSFNACRYAAMLAQTLHCKLTLFNLFEAPIIHSNMGLYGYPDDVNITKQDSSRKINGLTQKLLKEFPELNIDQFFTSGSFKSELRKFIKSHYIEAAVLGLESKHKFSKSIFGSNGTDLIGKIKTPVIIVPQSYKKHKLLKVVLAVDNSEKIHKTTLHDFESILLKTKCELELLHVRTEDEVFNPSKTDLTINKKKLPIISVLAKDLQDGIKRYCIKNQIDMVVAISKKHSVFYNFFIESISKKIAFVAKVPVMIIHE